MIFYEDGSLFEPDYRFHASMTKNRFYKFSLDWFTMQIGLRYMHCLALQICDSNEVCFKEVLWP